MRLIDRQAAIEVASKGCFELRGVFGRIEDGLNALPTIEAIPIEWIEKFRDQFDETDGFYDFLNTMLTIWKRYNKDNETN